MAKRYGNVRFRRPTQQAVIEATSGFVAVLLFMDAATRLGLRDVPGPAFALFLAMAYVSSGWRAPGAPPARLAGACMLAMILIVVPAGLWLRPLAGASVGGILFGVCLCVAVFGIATTMAASMIRTFAQPGTASLGIGGSDAVSRVNDDRLDGPSAAQSGAPLVLAATMNSVEPRISTMDIAAHDVRVGDLGVRSAHDIDGWLEPECLPTNWIGTVGSGREGVVEAAARRLFDIVISAGLLLATLPVLVLTAFAIRLETRGPIFYRQERVGRDGRVFTLFKFRSMTVDAEANGAAVWAVLKDPRVTRVGRFIRLTRIDEVPQVLNVLRGEMAFIGPRPERPVFVAQLERAIPHYADRAAVKPGITGWAQVRYRYGASVEDARMKLGYDLYYIQHRSLALDLRILTGTVRVVLLQEGAR